MVNPYKTTLTTTVDETTSTWTGVDIGIAHAARVVVLGTRSSAAITAITIGGISATKATPATAIWYASVPTGTTADIVVTSSGSLRKAVAVYVGYPASATPVDAVLKLTTAGISNAVALDLEVVVGGFVVYFAFQTLVATSFITTWSGADAVVEDVDGTLETTESYTSGHFATSVASTTDDLTLTPLVAAGTKTISAVSWGPAAVDTIATGRADENDSAFASALSELLATGRADEIDAALPLALSERLATGRADESDAALAFTLTERMAIVRSDEIDAPLSLTLSERITSGRADEIDAALAPSLSVRVAIGRADEIDTALARTLTERMATGRSDEIDAALAPTLRLATGRADEIDSALPQTLTERITTGRADESDAALPLALSERLATGRADESDAALAPGLTGHLATGRADESDVALAPALSARLLTGRADEIDAALAPSLTLVAGIAARLLGTLSARPLVSGTIELCGGVALAIDPCAFFFKAAPADNVLDLADLHEDVADVDMNAATVTLTGTDPETDAVVIPTMPMPQVSGNRYRAALSGSLGFVRGQRIDVVVLATEGTADGRFDARIIVR